MVQSLYLILFVLGAVLPLSQLIPFLTEHGPDLPLLVEQLFANRISGFFGFDVIISSLVLWLLVFTEGPRRQMAHLWVYIVCNLLVGVSLGLPLFLYNRERKLSQREAMEGSSSGARE
jgi:hypothetical protein